MPCNLWVKGILHAGSMSMIGLRQHDELPRDMLFEMEGGDSMNMQQDYEQRVEQMAAETSAEAVELMRELVAECKRLKQENERLRQTLIKSKRKTSMSSKLKDALYE